MSDNRKKIIIIVALAAGVVALAAGCCIIAFNIRKGSGKEKTVVAETVENVSEEETETPTVYVDNKVDIIDINSKTRPLAVSVNNTPVAVKVQTGLNRA